MDKRTLKATAIATIVVFLLALGFGELVTFYILTPSRHIGPGAIAGVCVLAVVVGLVVHARAKRER